MQLVKVTTAFMQLNARNVANIMLGQTSRHVGRRMYEHYTSIINENMELSVGEHFSSENHHKGWDDFKFYVLEFFSSPADEAHYY